MVTALVLDAGPLGLVVHPNPQPLFMNWFEGIRRSGLTIIVPEIADYEVRRELVRMGKQSSIERLDVLPDSLRYVPITTPIMRRAAQLWADARRQGLPTASERALDADVILAATALEIAADGEQTLVITTNTRHLARYTPAATWQTASLT